MLKTFLDSRVSLEKLELLIVVFSMDDIYDFYGCYKLFNTMWYSNILCYDILKNNKASVFYFWFSNGFQNTF
jgi:hypothetical protein